MHKMTLHWPMVVIAVLFVITTQIYSAALPPFEGPDEIEHFAYVLKLRQTGQLPYPPIDFESTAIRQQVSQAPLYYLIAALYSLPYSVDGLNPLQVNLNPWIGTPADPTSRDNRNYAVMNPAISALHPDQARLSHTLLAIRPISWVFGLIGLISVYWGGLALWHDRMWATLGATLWGFTPSILQTYAILTNDAAVIAFSMVTLAASFQLWRTPENRRLLIFTGMMMGLAALSKTSGIIVWAIPCLAILLGGLYRLHLRQMIVSGIALIVPAALIAGWWYMRGWVLFDDPLGTNPHQLMDWGFQELQTITAAIGRFDVIAQTLWVNFGWGEVRPGAWAYLIPSGIAILALIGLIRARLRLDIRLILAIVLLILGLVALIRWMQMSDLITGRLYLPYAGALTFLIVGGLIKLPLSRLIQAITPSVYIGLALIFVPLVLWPAFGPPILMDNPPDDLQHEVINFGVARFIGYSVSQDTIAQGDRLTVKLCWQAPQGTGPIPVPYAFAFHIVGSADLDRIQPNEPIVGRKESLPGLSKYTLWQPGKIFCDEFEVLITEPITERDYPLFVTLYDLTTTYGLPGYLDGTDQLHSKIIGYVRGRP
ncbi:MAG: hypothetical protein MUF87_05905 [Anaerolineae bacterium]|nr:hypothetical protein [Anaerolineae bacterium]